MNSRAARGWVSATAKTISATTMKKLWKKTGKSSTVRISFHDFNNIFILVVASLLASFMPILDLNFKLTT